jgi:hypothetical protein
LTDKETLDAARAVLRGWLDKQGHERCWYYPELFRELAELMHVHPTVTPKLPPREEFHAGCARYAMEEYDGRRDGSQ